MAGIPITSFANKVLSKEGAPRTQNMWLVEMNSGVEVVDKFFQDFTMYARDFRLPQIGLDYKNLTFHGFPIPVPCNPAVNQDMTVQMYADVEGGVQQSLRAWMTQIIDIDFQAGSYLGGTRSISPSSTMRLHLLDTDMQAITETCTLIGTTIQEIGELQFIQDAGNICMFNMKIKYVWPQYEFPEG